MANGTHFLRRLRSALIGVMLMLPLVPALAPASAAWSADDDDWCVTLPSQPAKPGSAVPPADRDACLVCTAAAIGGSADLAAPLPEAAAPSRLLSTLGPGPLSAAVHERPLRLLPIRAPPSATKSAKRTPAIGAAGCALT